MQQHIFLGTREAMWGNLKFHIQVALANTWDICWEQMHPIYLTPIGVPRTSVNIESIALVGFVPSRELFLIDIQTKLLLYHLIIAQIHLWRSSLDQRRKNSMLNGNGSIFVTYIIILYLRFTNISREVRDVLVTSWNWSIQWLLTWHEWRSQCQSERWNYTDPPNNSDGQC